ncbi:tripartite tricarboxylate transporter substrate binding protein [Thalassobacillus devorans]|uniref:tripartite tricarboxylate transporter substrate binding protein n=1 Tax=Thalassobacillus devorans TaxID=279813 RepID=UPI0004ACEF6E|nr:tripartite tricarboxylate transporter substrate binding protein [Thalassobacillus devorans]
MKKLLSILMLFGIILVLAACSGDANGNSSETNGGSSEESSSGNAEGFPDKPINVIVSYAAGGGTDTGARILFPYVEKELGVDVNIINKPGGGGWVGWTELANADPDGYTIGYINTPNLMTGYLDPKYKRDESLESFEPIANHVVDPGAIAIRADEERFTNIKELIEYAKENELTATSTGVGSDDHYASLKLNDKFGTKFKAVHNGGSADSRAAVLGGHVDVLFANVGELTSLHNEGKVKIIGVMGKEKSPFLEDVPTLAEEGYEVYSWSARGLAAPAGIDEEKLEVLRAALEKGIKNEEQKEKMAEMGLEVEYLDGEEYDQLLKEDEQAVKDLSDLMGW